MDGLNFLCKTWSLNMSGFEKMPYARQQISNLGVPKHLHGNIVKATKAYEGDPSPSGVTTGLRNILQSFISV